MAILNYCLSFHGLYTETQTIILKNSTYQFTHDTIAIPSSRVLPVSHTSYNDSLFCQCVSHDLLIHVKPQSILTVSELMIQLRDSGFTLRGVNLMLVPTTTCCSHDTPLFRMSTLEMWTGRHFLADCLSCQPTTGWWSTSSSGGDDPMDVSTRATLPASVTCFSKKPIGISCGDVNFLN